MAPKAPLMYYDPSQFPFAAILADNWRKVRNELESLHKSNFIPWPERGLYGQGWDVFGFYAFGKKLEANCAACPETTRLIEQIPNLTMAGFSSLAPGTHIAPHVGYTNAVLRCHLGLIVPSGCSMRVGSETREWTEGGVLIFDDTVEHEVWHRGTSPRVILLADFLRDPAVAAPAAPVYLADVVDDYASQH
jgi:aspartyl/asparaginyl beta-hydroxylase (cupin superfamily)